MRRLSLLPKPSESTALRASFCELTQEAFLHRPALLRCGIVKPSSSAASSCPLTSPPSLELVRLTFVPLRPPVTFVTSPRSLIGLSDRNWPYPPLLP